MIIAVQLEFSLDHYKKNDIISGFQPEAYCTIIMTHRKKSWSPLNFNTRVRVLIMWLSATALVKSELNSINRCPLHQDASCIINFKDSCGVCLVPTDLRSLFTRMRVKWETVSDVFRSESIYELYTHHCNHMYRDWHLWRQINRAMMMMITVRMKMEQVKTFYN